MPNIDPEVLRNEFSAKILSYDYSKGPLLILAGPGTGKTHSLLETIKCQVKAGAKLQDFFVTTLTNAAAGDFENDVKAQLSSEFENVSTLHFRAKGIVHQYADMVGLHPSFLVLSNLEKGCVLKEIQLHLSAIKKAKIKDVANFLKQYEKEAANNKTITFNSFVSIYRKLKKYYNVIDWYDVTYYACKILAENTNIFKKESSRQSFILVDEYQDLNKADQDLIKLMLGSSYLLVVGDDDQSIYGGRFADPSGIINFPTVYKGATKIVLPVCSRCPTPIIKASYSLISKNDSSNRFVKPQLVALRDTDKKADGGFIASVGLKSSKGEVEFLVAAIRAIINNNSDKANDIMVLCASRSLGLELIEMIRARDPGISIDDKLTKEDKEPMCLIANYLKRFLNDHNDNLALRMFMDLFLKIPAKIFAIAYALEEDDSLWGTLQRIVTKKGLKKEKIVLDKFIDIIRSSENRSIEEKLNIFAHEYPELKEALDDILRSQEGYKAALPEDEQRSIKVISAKGIKFMTMHRSKGLDAKYVFIPFMEDEIKLPATDIEEQRRLLYVALTRARVSVVLSWAFSRRSATRHRAGGGGFMRRLRSTFINDCGISKDLPPNYVINRLSQVAQRS